EDGIRDFHVTGVQTCALPIYADVLMMRNAEPGQVVPLLSHHAMRLAYLAEPGEILLTTAARDRVITQFTVHYENRHGQAQHVLEIGRASCRERLCTAVVAVPL